MHRQKGPSAHPALPPPPGDVINHGKHDFWGRSGVHYHQGMKVGAGLAHSLHCMPLVLRGGPPAWTLPCPHGASFGPNLQPGSHRPPRARLPAPRPQAGENTLNAICARLVVRTMARDGGWVGVGGLGAAWRDMLMRDRAVGVLLVAWGVRSAAEAEGHPQAPLHLALAVHTANAVWMQCARVCLEAPLAFNRM